jgi:hypothetical protein
VDDKTSLNEMETEQERYLNALPEVRRATTIKILFKSIKHK